MEFPDMEVSIRSPRELTVLLQHVKRCLSTGVLQQISLPNSLAAAADIAQLPDAGPWPDYVAAYFKNDQGQHYKLTVETYHGAGGSWSPVSQLG